MCGMADWLIPVTWHIICDVSLWLYSCRIISHVMMRHMWCVMSQQYVSEPYRTYEMSCVVVTECVSRHVTWDDTSHVMCAMWHGTSHTSHSLTCCDMTHHMCGTNSFTCVMRALNSCRTKRCDWIRVAHRNVNEFVSHRHHMWCLYDNIMHCVNWMNSCRI